ncbi:MAG TPA: phosphoglycerate mutase family protein [Planctomycetota bacterium]|nr:phosphoglycerate mutase family protein [Planctomycetota bacterium]
MASITSPPSRRAAALALFVFVAAFVPQDGGKQAAPAAPHTVILVRHAEKASDGEDPDLSDGGKQRAEALARLLAHAGVRRLVATPYARTRATLEPLARVTGVAIDVAPADRPAQLAAELRAAEPGSVTVVAGHSNTLPSLARALGVQLRDLDARGWLRDDAFDRVFVVTLPPRDAALSPALLELRYGAGG